MKKRFFKDAFQNYISFIKWSRQHDKNISKARLFLIMRPEFISNHRTYKIGIKAITIRRLLARCNESLIRKGLTS
jgi:hypothetical protein